ncbi:MAG: NADH-quinone oxidoreductase subunit M [Firmicutes bacterium]|jgi:proton-translocating NADH-quinone oxidoreductase chain M|nr:NADH-quinone oxidoreductase subunit M [Bacillota bacterium]HPU00529.1 NADH-quinone oxidoreductase subunit M [Bacillota bacterium]
MSVSMLPLLVFLIPLLASIVCLLIKERPRLAQEITLAACLATAAFSLTLAAAVLRSGTVATELAWIKTFGFEFNLIVDALGAFTVVTITVLMAIDMIYTRGYMAPEEAGSRFYGWTLMFTAAMVGAVMAADLVQFYFLWELMLIPSTILIVYWGGGPRPQATGFKYFVVTHVGAALILAAILWILSVTGESGIYTLQSVLAALPRPTLMVLASLFTVGFAVKMAIFPAHVWLPDAHSEAPLPVSVMLSAIMMNMGIYGMVRFLFTLFPPEVSSALLLPLLIFAVVSQWYGGLQALRSTEMKRVAAYSTISQMGYVLVGIASMSALGLKGSIFHMLNHGTAKALLFMSIGAVIHSTGATHLDKVGGLARKMPWTALCCSVAALALAGAPPLGAFQSEWIIFAGGFSTPYTVLAVIAVCASVLTAFYVLRLVAKIFFGPEFSESGNMSEVREAPSSMLASMLALSLLSLAVGIYPHYFHRWIEAALNSFGLF